MAKTRAAGRPRRGGAARAGGLAATPPGLGRRRGLHLVAAAKDAPRTAGEALAEGERLRQAGAAAEALQHLEGGLELPCSAEGGEPCAATRTDTLLAIARCQDALRDQRKGLMAVAGLLECGWEDFEALRADPGLAFLRQSPKFRGLLAMYGDPSPPVPQEDLWQEGKIGHQKFFQMDVSDKSPLERALRGEWMWNLLTKKSTFGEPGPDD